MHVEERCNLLHRVDAGGEGSSHRLVTGIPAREAGERLRQQPALRARDLAKPLQGLGRRAMALGETLTAEKDLMT